MDQQATQSRPAPDGKIGLTPFISAGQGELAELRAPPIDLDELWAKLSHAPGDAQQAKDECAAVLAQHGSMAGRARIVDALRTSEPMHFRLEVNRVAAFQALTPYLDEEDVCSIFVEELQAHPENLRACESAFAAVQKVDLSKFPAIERICLKSVRDRLELLISNEEPNTPIDRMSIALLKSCKPEERDAMLKDMALGTYRAGSVSGQAVLEALAQIGGENSVKLLSRIANERVLPDKLEVSQGEGLVTAGALSGLAAGGWAGFSLAAAIMQHWKAPFGLPIIAGLGAGVAALGVIFLSQFAIFYQLAILKVGGKNVNSRMAQAARHVLGSGAESLATGLAHEYVETVLSDKSERDARTTAATLLGKFEIRNGKEVRELLAGCKAEQAFTRHCCIQALASTLTPEVLAIIEPLRRDPDPGVRVLVTKLLSGKRRAFEEGAGSAY
ncbi:MAG: hypothetical protein K1X83_04225 [Oligoflexia bacterium]|nr:hypothetical protein [Oligoflexia bacterium]